MAFTFFFRDSQTLERAIDDAFPSLQGRAFIHVWDAGCAHGCEPYTLAILLRERMSNYIFDNVRIHATDADVSFAGQVTTGVFAEEEVKRVPPGILAKYFQPAPTTGFVQAVPELRNKVSFLHHDLLSLRPIREGLSLVLCKNVLLHFDGRQRCDVLRMFHQALQPGGILVMENTQKLPETLSPFFRQVAPYVQVYRKLEPAFGEHQSEQCVSRRHSELRVDAAGYGPLPDLRTSHRRQAEA